MRISKLFLLVLSIYLLNSNIFANKDTNMFSHRKNTVKIISNNENQNSSSYSRENNILLTYFINLNIFLYNAKVITPSNFPIYTNVGMDTGNNIGSDTSGFAGDFSVGINIYKYFFIGASYLKTSSFQETYSGNFFKENYQHLYKYQSVNLFTGLHIPLWYSLRLNLRLGTSYVIINNQLDGINNTSVTSNSFINKAIRPMYGISLDYIVNHWFFELSYLSILGDSSKNPPSNPNSNINEVEDSKMPTVQFIGLGIGYQF
ncbi:hypothetical protein L3V83_15500 [Thiotrichales bacterium 19X7-9]|nr:hypothetical protein [Thiotrichales bacterium 19X7-9]